MQRSGSCHTRQRSQRTASSSTMPQLATYGAKVPVSVVTGFLGSGKTTLLNYLLGLKGDRNIAVIENEFGEVNIDRTLVSDKLAAPEDLVSLENGCVCCSLRKDIVKAFAELQRRNAGRQRPMDHVLLETTGLADPSPVAFTFFANPWVAARFKLDSITCVVDAKHLMQHLEDSHNGHAAINEAVQQIAFSDLILLNKTDLVSAEGKQDVLDAIKRINNTARIIECQLNTEEGRPPVDQILGTNAFSVQRALAVDPTFLDTDSDSDTSSPHLTEGSTEQHKCDHDHKAEATAAQQPEEAGTGESSGPQQSPQAQQQQGQQGQPQSHKRPLSDPCSCDPDSAQNEKKPKRRRKKLHDLSGVSSVGITSRGQLDEYRFNMFMRDLLSEKAKDIFRCKGVLSVHGYGSKKFVFQGVHETICYGPAEVPWQEGEPRMNQIVFIGRGLDRKTLTEGFRTCIWQSLPEGWEEALDEKTKKPFYWHKQTGQKSWTRPTSQAHGTLADVTSHHASTMQPASLAPRRTRTAQSLPSLTGSGAAGSPTGAGEGEQQQQGSGSKGEQQQGGAAVLVA